MQSKCKKMNTIQMHKNECNPNAKKWIQSKCKKMNAIQMHKNEYNPNA